MRQRGARAGGSARGPRRRSAAHPRRMRSTPAGGRTRPTISARRPSSRWASATKRSATWRARPTRASRGWSGSRVDPMLARAARRSAVRGPGRQRLFAAEQPRSRRPERPDGGRCAPRSTPLVVLAAATYGVLLRIAEAKVEASVGGGELSARRDTRPSELAAFQRLRASLAGSASRPLRDRLERAAAGRSDPGRARRSGPTAGPSLPSRCGWCAGSTSAAGAAGPAGPPLSPPLPPGIPRRQPDARSPAISLAGALRHELAHHDGMIRARPTRYAAEIAVVRGRCARRPWFASLAGQERATSATGPSSPRSCTARRASKKTARDERGAS